MLPAFRVLLLTLGVLLISGPAAQAASKSLALPAEGQVAVTFTSGAKRVKVQSAPVGVTVAGGVKSGKLAVAVIRPRGAANGKVVLTLTRQAEGLEDGGRGARRRQGAVLPGPRQAAGQAPEGPGGREGPRARARREAVREARAADAAAILTPLGLGAAPAPPAPSAPAAAPGGGGRLQPPAPRSTPTPTAPAGKACANGADDDNDGQTDLEDPGCADGNDPSEDSEVTVPAACSENSGVGMGDDPTVARRGHQRLRAVHQDPRSTSPRGSPAATSSPAGRNGRARPGSAPVRRSTRRT